MSESHESGRKLADPGETPLVTDAVDVVGELYRAFHTADRDTIVATVTRYFDAEVVLTEPDAMPWGGVYQGIDVVLPMIAAFADPGGPMPPEKIQVDQLFVQSVADGADEQVVAAVSFPFQGKETVVPMRALEWFTVRAGKIVEIKIFQCETVEALAALDGELAADAT
ncbi:nuclear transport factor 2 family protein [Streptomyces sp. NPDC057137]|uniref:nuclear transport factor 2 family protein n=1 Tax=Streptomyces sp. NPDC057137 TaxID=3346030 RepID=UPI0036263529